MIALAIDGSALGKCFLSAEGCDSKWYNGPNQIYVAILSRRVLNIVWPDRVDRTFVAPFPPG